MRHLTLIALIALAGCENEYLPPCEPQPATVLGSVPGKGLSACVNGANNTTVQFKDGTVQTICVTAERGDQLRVCK